MFSIKKKLDKNLIDAMHNERYKTYRVIIHCNALIEKVQKRILSSKGELIGAVTSINCIFANLSPRYIERLIEYPEINYITFDDLAYLCGNSISSANNVSLSQKLKYTGKGVCIGIVDSGVYPHPDLGSPFRKIEKFKDIVNGLNYPYDDNGHGTFMSGIICSSGSNSKGMYKGIAPNSSLYCIKAFNSIGKGFISNILIAIDTLISEAKELNIRVICLPFEIPSQNEFIISIFHKLFDMAIGNNLVIVVPSGNNETNFSSIRGIAALNNCITVGGLDTTDVTTVYTYSACGPCGKLIKPDFSTACVNICSLSSDRSYISERNGSKVYPRKMQNYYTTYTGTSCAAAYVSGLCALLIESNENLHFKDIISLLKSACKPLELPKWQQGEGFLDVNVLFSEE